MQTSGVISAIAIPVCVGDDNIIIVNTTANNSINSQYSGVFACSVFNNTRLNMTNVTFNNSVGSYASGLVGYGYNDTIFGFNIT